VRHLTLTAWLDNRGRTILAIGVFATQEGKTVMPIEKYVLLPSPEHLLLMKYLLVLMLLIHLPYISMMVGGAFFSVSFRILSILKRQNQIYPVRKGSVFKGGYSGRDYGQAKNESKTSFEFSNGVYLRFAKDLIDTVAVNRSAGFILGILPLIVVTLIDTQILYMSNATTVGFLVYSIILVLLSFILLYIYKDTFHTSESNRRVHILLGILGVLLLLTAYFIFIGSTTLLVDPEKWTFIGNPFQLILSLNTISKYLHFILSSFAITGGGILFFFFVWSGGRKTLDENYSGFVRKLGLTLTMISALPLPLFDLWNLYTLPEVSLSPSVFGMSALAVLLLSFICFMIYAMVKNPEKKFGSHVFVSFLLIFLVMIIKDSTARENAVREHTSVLIARAEEELASKQERAVTTETKVIENRGEKVYKEMCVACHLFDKKLVGPPYNEVLPKYRNNIEELKAFIRNPFVRNPAYPPMPKLGLKEEDIEAVAGYLLKRMEGEHKQ